MWEETQEPGLRLVTDDDHKIKFWMVSVQHFINDAPGLGTSDLDGFAVVKSV